MNTSRMVGSLKGSNGFLSPTPSHEPGFMSARMLKSPSDKETAIQMLTQEVKNYVDPYKDRYSRQPRVRLTKTFFAKNEQSDHDFGDIDNSDAKLEQ